MKPTLAVRGLLLASTLLAAANSAHAINLYWDIDDATPGAGGTTPSDIWTTDGKTWSTSPDGTVATSALTTTLLSDLFFSAGVNATGAYTIDLTTTQQARSLTFRSGTPTIGGDGVIDFGATGSGIIRVNNLYTTSSPKGEVPINATIGNGTSTVIAGSVGLTKTGVGLLNLSSSAVHTFTGGLHVNGGTLNLNFANLADPTNMIDSGNALSFGGGNLLGHHLRLHRLPRRHLVFLRHQ